ncbi:SRPBCC family protein [Planococcus sp. 1R117A]|uniref:SRPBCC family protein n=1 Tax=Planococcus sp. 1R117A TaxID=3447020 RepID=UPI003EDC5338
MVTVEKSILIERPIDEVYQYAADPTRWYQWYVGLSEPRNLKGQGETGTTMDLDFNILGMQLPVIVAVTENSQNGNGYTWKGMVKGSIDSLQNWTYTPEGNGTRVDYFEEYEVPHSLLMKMADKLIIKKLMSNAMDQSLKNLKDVCESSKTTAL